MVTWKKLNSRSVGSTSSSDELPGQRGRRLIHIPDLVPDRYVHFSWWEESHCTRDFIGSKETRQEPGFTATDIWKMRKGPVFQADRVPVSDRDFWTKRLTNLTNEVLQQDRYLNRTEAETAWIKEMSKAGIPLSSITVRCMFAVTRDSKGRNRCKFGKTPLWDHEVHLLDGKVLKTEFEPWIQRLVESGQKHQKAGSSKQ